MCPTAGGRWSRHFGELERGAKAGPCKLPVEARWIRTPLKAEAWEAMLEGHPDRVLAEIVLRGIREGFRVGFHGNLADLQPCKQNLISVREHPEVVQEYLKQEVMAGRIIEVGNLRQAQALGIHCSPFGVIPKKGRAGRWRLIVDLSSPDGHSINDGISRELSSLSYMSVDDVMAEVVRRGKGTLMAKMDIKQAYRNIPVHPVDRVLLGMHWQGREFVDGCLPFGLRSAPLLFTAVGDLLQWVMERCGVSWLGHYIDDFVTLGDSGAVDCRDHLQIMKAVREEAGICPQSQKKRKAQPRC